MTTFVQDYNLTIMIGVVVLQWCVGFFFGVIAERKRWRGEMIRRKYASYNWITGKWQWGFPPATNKDLDSTAPYAYPPTKIKG